MTMIAAKQTTPVDKTANNVTVSDRFYRGGYADSIGCIMQRDAKHEQQVFAIDPAFDSEFIVGLKDHERVIRLSTPLSSNQHTEHRHIAKISLVTGKVSHVDHELYESESVVKWDRGLKAQFITLPSSSLPYFGA